MGDITKERAGFSGQNVHVGIMSESELLGEAHGYPPNTINAWLNPILNRALKDPSFVHIRLIDEYGTTFFSGLQLLEVTKELERLHEFTRSP
jgi:hypothetical protein